MSKCITAVHEIVGEYFELITSSSMRQFTRFIVWLTTWTADDAETTSVTKSR